MPAKHLIRAARLQRFVSMGTGYCTPALCKREVYVCEMCLHALMDFGGKGGIFGDVECLLFFTLKDVDNDKETIVEFDVASVLIASLFFYFFLDFNNNTLIPQHGV